MHPGSRVFRFSTLLVLVLAVLALSACSRLTQANFDKIEKGATYEEVEAILGKPTDSSSVGVGPLSATNAVWEDEKTRITIKFVNQKVQIKTLKTKDGAGDSGG